MSSSSSTMRIRSSAMVSLWSSEAEYKHRMGAAAGELRAALEVRALDAETEAHHAGAEPFDELCGGGGRPARCQHIVDDQYRLPGRESVHVNLEDVGAVLEAVGDSLGLPRELPRFAGWHETQSELARDRRSEHESARFDPDDFLCRDVAERVRHLDHRACERLGRREERRDVAKEDAGRREIRYVPDEPAKVGHVVIWNDSNRSGSLSSTRTSDTRPPSGPFRISSR